MMRSLTAPLRALLLASLAVNLLLIGGLIGAHAAGLRLTRDDQSAALQQLARPRAFMNGLEPERRADMRRVLRRAWRDGRDERLNARAARNDAYDIVLAEPYDAAAARAAFARMRAADQDVIGIFHDGIADMLADLSADERRALVEALRRAPRLRDQVGDQSDDQPGQVREE